MIDCRLRVSIKSEPCLRYYNLKDIPKVLQALHSSLHHIPVYSEISRGILQYWDIESDNLPGLETTKLFEQSATLQNDVGCCTPFILPGKGSHEVVDPAIGEKLASCTTENRVGNEVVQCHDPNIVPQINKSSLDSMAQPEHPSQQRSGDISAKQVCLLKNTDFSEQSKVNHAVYSGSAIQQADSSDLTHQSLHGKPSFIESATCTSGNSNGSYGGHANGNDITVNNTYPQSKEGSGRVSGRGYGSSSGGYSYMGSHFKPQAYVNNYTHGDFAASAAANLAVLLPEENQVSGSQASDKRRKVVTANNLLQVKAFSSSAIRFFWPNCEKKLVEVPRERCGWCLSCKAAVSCKKGCLLNAAVSNAIKGAVKIIAGLRIKNREGSLPGIATYVIFMEESLGGLTVGLFRSATYRKQWRKRVEEATSCSEVKVLLLEVSMLLHFSFLHCMVTKLDIVLATFLLFLFAENAGLAVPCSFDLELNHLTLCPVICSYSIHFVIRTAHLFFWLVTCIALPFGLAYVDVNLLLIQNNTQRQFLFQKI